MDLDLSVVDSAFGGAPAKVNGAANPPARAAAADDEPDELPENAQPIEPIARPAARGEVTDPDVEDPPVDEAAAARRVAQRLKTAPYLDLSTLPPESRMVVQHALEQVEAKARDVREREVRAGDALEHADLVNLIRNDAELNQVVRGVIEKRRSAAAAQAAGQPPTPAAPVEAMPDIQEEFAGLGADQLEVIQRLERRNVARQEAANTRMRDTVVQFLQAVVGPIKKQHADAEAGRQWQTFAGAVPDWNRHVSPEALKQRVAGAPHVRIDEHFYAAAGPKLYAENQQLKRKLTEMLSGNRPSPPSVTRSRRPSVEPAVDENDWGTAIDAIWNALEGGA